MGTNPGTCSILVCPNKDNVSVRRARLDCVQPGLYSIYLLSSFLRGFIILLLEQKLICLNGGKFGKFARTFRTETANFCLLLDLENKGRSSANLETKHDEINSSLRQETLVCNIELFLSRKVPYRYQVLHPS